MRLFLFAPGAGAPSSSAWMKAWARRLEALGTVRAFDYAYMREGRRTPDRLPALVAAHRAALEEARQARQARQGHEGSVFLIGKSMGGRVGCHLSLEEAVDGVVCLGYPLRSPTGALRDEVLKAMKTRILFVQGTRDPLCPLELLAEVRPQMSAPSTLHVVEGGDHSLMVRKRELKSAGLTQDDVDREILRVIASFAETPA